MNNPEPNRQLEKQTLESARKLLSEISGQWHLDRDSDCIKSNDYTIADFKSLNPADILLAAQAPVFIETLLGMIDRASETVAMLKKQTGYTGKDYTSHCAMKLQDQNFIQFLQKRYNNQDNKPETKAAAKAMEKALKAELKIKSKKDLLWNQAKAEHWLAICREFEQQAKPIAND